MKRSPLRRKCSVVQCNGIELRRGLCNAHRIRLRRHGNVDAGRPVRLVLPPMPQRFWMNVVKSEGCWEWTSRRDRYGYGQLSFGGASHAAHRVAYELLVGPVPEGLTIDHLCRNRTCVNPDHMEAVTNRENVLRGEGLAARFARRNACDKGHPFTGANLRVRPDGSRACRACDRMRKREVA